MLRIIEHDWKPPPWCATRMNPKMNLNTTHILAMGIACLFLTACSKPTETIIPSDMSTWDKELAPVVKKLSEEDQKLLTGYVARAKLGEVFEGKGIPLGTTVGTAIEHQREWIAAEKRKEAEAAALKAKIEQERAAAIKAIDDAVTVALISKIERPANPSAGQYRGEQVFKIGVKNNSEKRLAGVSGEIHFIDLFDKKVGEVNFRITETVRPGESYTWVGSRDYNQFIDSHRTLWNLEEGKYKTRFIPEAVVFADGTKLEMPK